MKNYNYSRYSSTEFCWSDSPVLFTSIAFFVSYDYDDKDMPGMIMKHGTVEQIEAYSIKQREALQNLSEDPVFFSTRFFMLDVTKIALENLDEINKCIEISGYVGTFLKKFDLLPDEFDGEEID